jgi:YidC/Oxa1 family membrane protein insertase
MDKRFFLAIALAIGVVLITPKLFPPPPAPIMTAVDSAAVPAAGTAPASAPVPTTVQATPAAAPAGAGATGTAAFAPETTNVATPKAVFHFSNAGASLIGATLEDYVVLPKRDHPVELGRRGGALVTYRLIQGADTTDLRGVRFHSTPGAVSAANGIRYDGDAPNAALTLQYTFVADSYLVRVAGTITPKSVAGTPALIGIVLPQGLATAEADTIDDHRMLAYVFKPVTDDPESVPFSKVAKKGIIAQVGPFDWVASKSKYFLLAVMAPPKGQFTGPAIFTAPPSTEKAPSVATGEVILAPDAEGRFAFEIYAGPQQWRRLVALGHGLEHANPYGGFLRAVVQPFATFVMTVLLWMHDKLQLNYGWVLVIFGVGIRLLLWPLNQSAMRSSLRMQRIQPELQALQAKYKANPEKMQAEYMKLLKDNGMTPFSQFTGCLPMLIPMPVLFALFFVFQNTIEFRGVSFLWLADISQKDPYYILPVAMGLSMFLLSWIGLRNSPPNPQAKMFGYMMPAMMTVFFLNFPAGLNLYYAVQNLAALPQQWLIAKERAKNPPRPPSS